ncbi:MAG: hypothetical protein IT323_13610 [Anaerolineae bacterium]|nr:hypothetical protein [Anaerolineae bacterium]
MTTISTDRTGRTDGRTNQNGTCPPGNAPHPLITALIAEYKGRNVEEPYVTHVPGGQVVLCFPLKDGSKYPRLPSRTDLAVQWMKDHRVLERRRFMDECPHARQSNDLHWRAIKRLAQQGDITKENGLWIWSE